MKKTFSPKLTVLCLSVIFIILGVFSLIKTEFKSNTNVEDSIEESIPAFNHPSKFAEYHKSFRANPTTEFMNVEGLAENRESEIFIQNSLENRIRTLHLNNNNSKINMTEFPPEM